MESIEDRRVGLDEIGEYRVSTVRLSIDHGWGGTPLWYETMVFKDDSWEDLYCDRYETKEQAEAGHARVVAAMKESGKPPAYEDAEPDDA